MCVFLWVYVCACASVCWRATVNSLLSWGISHLCLHHSCDCQATQVSPMYPAVPLSPGHLEPVWQPSPYGGLIRPTTMAWWGVWCPTRNTTSISIFCSYSSYLMCLRTDEVRYFHRCWVSTLEHLGSHICLCVFGVKCWSTRGVFKQDYPVSKISVKED